MNWPYQWWQQRKSRIGCSPIAHPPPLLPSGAEWWTEPPVSAPQPEHIEYAVQFACRLQAEPRSDMRNSMQAYIANWLRAAKRLLHEESAAPQRKDLVTTDGLIIAAAGAMMSLIGCVISLGGKPHDHILEVSAALRGRADKLRRERAMESAKTRSIATHAVKRNVR